MKCNLCPRRCNAQRTDFDNIGGYCNQPLLPVVARAALHFWEEPVISGKNGSGTVFFSGCNLGCIYCQNAEISKYGKGKRISAEELANIFLRLENEGAHNINLVTPTHFTDAIISALDIYRPGIPIVYNSGGYESEEQLDRLKEYIDVYLLDIKYLDSLRAAKYSNAPDYPEVAKKTLKIAYTQKGSAIIKNGIMQSGVIVRHLLLPAGTNDAIGVYDFVRQNANGAYFSLMSQYIPCDKAKEDKTINRKITKREYEKVAGYILEHNIHNCFIQELSSADSAYIPDFNYEGI